METKIVRKFKTLAEVREKSGWRKVGYWHEVEIVIPSRPSAEIWSRLRAKVFERDDYTCAYCGDRGGRLECDHVIPVSKGGSHDELNLVTSCFDCNRSKRDKLLSEWRRD